ncbi:MAG: hypothetical protein J6Y02_01235 [Pseudobutyrivibrio sp.]|nr:hypothetical protein [Pseudobutyrivibrio sp.]
MDTRKEIGQLTHEMEGLLEKLYNLGYLNGVNNTVREFQPEIKKSYKEGLKDAWECARKIACMDWEDDTKLFGCENPFEIYSASEAIAKIEEYEESQKCKECVHYPENGISCNAVCIRCFNNDRFVKNELHKEYEVEERFDEETRSVKYMFKEKKPEDTLEKQEEDIDTAFKELKKKKEEKSCKNCNTACSLPREFFRDRDISCSDWTPKHLKEGNHV